MLYVNLATDGLPALALAVDPPERDLMRRPPRNRRAGIFTRPVVAPDRCSAASGRPPSPSACSVWTLGSGGGLAEARTTIFATLILIELFKAFSFRSDRRSTLGGHVREPMAEPRGRLGDRAAHCS